MSRYFFFLSHLNIIDSKTCLQPGYYLKPLGPYNFSCQKLGQINVRIYSEEAPEVFPPVLFSLSGEHGYRNNSISKAGGVHVFDNLFPSSFYLRPLLKVLDMIICSFYI